MKVKIIALAILLSAGTAGSAFAENVQDQGHGQVKFHGTIIDAPCSIDPDSIEQTVEFGQLSNTVMENGGHSPSKPFDIKLVGCNLKKGEKSVTTTFTGAAGAEGRLGVSGNATGISIALQDGTGAPIELGTASSPTTLTNGDTDLLFSAYVQGDGASVGTGEFNSVADFTLAYQ